MKMITEEQLASITDTIIKEKQRQADILHQTFNGISSDALYDEIGKRMGDKWTLKPNVQIKFTKADINAVATSRFNRRSGLQLLMGLVIIIFAMAFAVRYIPLSQIGYNIYYTLMGAIALGFIWIYTRKQAKVRKELWRQIGREDSKDDK